MDEDTGVCDIPNNPIVMQRATTTGYKETSQRKVSNKPSWMTTMVDGGCHTDVKTKIEELSDDEGEYCYDDMNMKAKIEELSDDEGEYY